MKSNIRFLTSECLTKAGIVHGWFMRYGGVSKGLFESLNGKKGNGDTDLHVGENRCRALAGLCHPELDSGSNCDKDSCLRRSNAMGFITHVFGDSINKVTEPGEYKGYDASFTAKSEVVLAQATADCGSIIVADTKGSVVSIIHGSWHTLATNIICETVANMKQHSSDEFVAGIGPMICKNCYEYGPEANNLFDHRYLQKNGDAYLVDLKQMIYDQLKEAGITQIDDLNICTLEDERFFSHRRDGAHSGRFLTLASTSKVVAVTL